MSKTAKRISVQSPDWSANKGRDLNALDHLEVNEELFQNTLNYDLKNEPIDYSLKQDSFEALTQTLQIGQRNVNNRTYQERERKRSVMTMGHVDENVERFENSQEQHVGARRFSQQNQTALYQSNTQNYSAEKSMKSGIGDFTKYQRQSRPQSSLAMLKNPIFQRENIDINEYISTVQESIIKSQNYQSEHSNMVQKLLMKRERIQSAMSTNFHSINQGLRNATLMKPNIDKDFKSPCSKFRQKQRTRTHRLSNSITTDIKTITENGDRYNNRRKSTHTGDQDYNSNLQSTVSPFNSTLKGPNQKHRRLKTAMTRKQSEPTNYAEKFGTKSSTIKSRNSLKNRNSHQVAYNISNTDIDAVTHIDTTISKTNIDNNKQFSNQCSQNSTSFLNIQDHEKHEEERVSRPLSSLSRKMSKVKIKKLARTTIKVDQELKLERELRVSVIDGTGSTALQRQYDAIRMKAKEKEQELQELRKQLLLLKSQSVQAIDITIFEKMHQVVNGVSIEAVKEEEDAAIVKAAQEQTDFLFGKQPRFRSSSGFESVHEVMRDAITKFKTVQTPKSPTVQRTKSESQISQVKIGQKKKLTFKEKNQIKTLLQQKYGLEEELDNLVNKKQKEEGYIKEQCKSKINNELKDIYSIKIKIENLMPEYRRYNYIATDFKRLQLLHKTRVSTNKDFRNGRKTEVMDKLRTFENKLQIKAERVGLATKSIRKMKTLCEEKQIRIETINEYIEQYNNTKEKREIQHLLELKIVASKFDELIIVKNIQIFKEFQTVLRNKYNLFDPNVNDDRNPGKSQELLILQAFSNEILENITDLSKWKTNPDQGSTRRTSSKARGDIARRQSVVSKTNSRFSQQSESLNKQSSSTTINHKQRLDDADQKIQEYHYHYENIRPIWDQIAPKQSEDGIDIAEIIDVNFIEKKVEQQNIMNQSLLKRANILQSEIQENKAISDNLFLYFMSTSKGDGKILETTTTERQATQLDQRSSYISSQTKRLEITIIGDVEDVDKDIATHREVEVNDFKSNDSPRDPEDSIHYKETFATLKFKDLTKRFEQIQNEKEKNYSFYFQAYQASRNINERYMFIMHEIMSFIGNEKLVDAIFSQDLLQALNSIEAAVMNEHERCQHKRSKAANRKMTKGHIHQVFINQLTNRRSEKQSAEQMKQFQHQLMETEFSNTDSSIQFTLDEEQRVPGVLNAFDLMNNLDFKRELKMICDMFAGLQTLVSRAETDKSSITVADYRELKLSIDNNPRLKNISHASSMNVQKKNEIDEKNARAKATGEIQKTQTSQDEPKQHLKHSFIKHKHKHEHSQDGIDYIDKQTNGIIAGKLYEEQAKLEQAAAHKEAIRVHQLAIDNMTQSQKQCEMFHEFNQNRTLIRKYEREEKEYMTKFTVERPKILKKLYKINAANNDLLTPNASQTEMADFDTHHRTTQNQPVKALNKIIHKRVESKIRGIIRLSKGTTQTFQ